MPAVKLTLINSNPQEISPEDWAEICYELFNVILANTPVDTGQCLGSWEIDQTADDIFEIRNPVEYASFLEDGWSDQSPNGMMQPAMDELPKIIRSIIKKKPKGHVYATMEVPDYVPKG